MKTTTTALLACFLLVLSACQRGEQTATPTYADGVITDQSTPESSASKIATTPPPAANMFQSAAALTGIPDSSMRFIRTAELRFRVQNAVSATLTVEDIVLQNGGFVIDNDLSTEVQFRDVIPVSSDSLLEKTNVVLTNRVTVRVPTAKLDTTLRAIGRLVDFLDYRRVHARDVWLELLEQELAQSREQNFQEESNTADKDKAADRLAAAQARRDSRANTDNARVERLRTEDAIRYSTVTLDIYQRAEMQYRMLPREQPVTAFRPGFGTQLWEAIVQGWQTLRAIFFGLLQNWSILLLLGGAFYIFARIWRKRA
ncbi:MAG: DUF4349 domain-containing protein [Lewinellaceae bacterium]|nr:DUF4349 domain-containing protein [Lewinellaceae bacterium]